MVGSHDMQAYISLLVQLLTIPGCDVSYLPKL
jgi:hypothetical protein